MGSHVSQADFNLGRAKDDLELVIFLPPPLKCSDYRHVPPSPVYVVLVIEPAALCMVSTPPPELHPTPVSVYMRQGLAL